MECLKEFVDTSKYQKFRKVSASCKNNGKTVFVRLLFESKLYRGGFIRGSDDQLMGLPVSYLIEVNKGILKGNEMNYDIGDGILYKDKFSVYKDTIKLDKTSKLNREKHILYNYIKKFDIPKVKTK
jgi:hypothetical protein